MTTASILLASLASASTAAGLTYLYFQSRLNAARASANLFAAWWERDSAKMLIAQAQLDLIHQQHVDAGRKAHEPARALRRETTEKLIQCLALRDPGSTQPATDPEPVMGFPADLSAGRKASARGRVRASQTGQDIGRGHPPHVTPRASDRNEPDDTCDRNRAGYRAPAEFPPIMKGAI